MINPKFKNGCYTWTNRQSGVDFITQKLDSFLLFENWIYSSTIWEASILPFTSLDHFPITLLLPNDNVPIQCPFKFEKMWLRDENLKELIAQWWSSAPVVKGTKNLRVVRKLKILKERLKEWNRTHFGNIFADKIRTENNLVEINEKII